MNFNDKLNHQITSILIQTIIYLYMLFPTLVNLEHISSASFIIFARSMYFAHLELMNRSAVSKDCASSIHFAASLRLPICCRKRGVREICLENMRAIERNINENRLEIEHDVISLPRKLGNYEST